MGQQSELLIRLAIGTILGAIIGYERHVHGRPVYELISWSGSPPKKISSRWTLRVLLLPL